MIKRGKRIQSRMGAVKIPMMMKSMRKSGVTNEYFNTTFAK